MAGRVLGFIAAAGLLAAPSVASAEPTPAGGLTNSLAVNGQCSFCHGYTNASADLQEPAYSPFNTWQGTMMANSARDPVFWAGIAVAADDDPEEAETCVRCHAPRAFLDGNETVTAIQDLTDFQRGGVECELCHRTERDPGVPPGNALYTIDDTIVGNNVPRRGPWEYDDGVPEPLHDWMYDPYIGTSRLCGTCHDVTTSTERVDDAGVGLGVGFNEQRTFSEWENSAYAEPGDDFQSCQDCHMTPVADKPGCSDHVNQFTHATGGRRHDFNGANRFMLELLRDELGSLGGNEIADIYFDMNIERMDEFLATAASLDVTAPDTLAIQDGLSNLEVLVTNNSGHKLPSGYSEGRIMWLEVEASYAGEVLFTSGTWDQTTGIEQDAQLRTYEGVGEDDADGQQFRLLRNNHWVVDSRIPALGQTPDIQTDPVGDRYALLPDGTWPNYDSTSYTFAGIPVLDDVTPDNADDDVLDVVVRLRYLINTPQYIDFLEANGGQAGTHVAGLFDERGGATPVTLAQSQVAIALTGLERPAASSSSSDGGDTTTSGSGASETTPGTSSTTTPPSGTTDVTASADSGESSSGGPAAGGDDGGCGCTGGSGSGGLPLLLLPFLALGRRRRTSTGA